MVPMFVVRFWSSRSSLQYWLSVPSGLAVMMLGSVAGVGQQGCR